MCSFRILFSVFSSISIQKHSPIHNKSSFCCQNQCRCILLTSPHLPLSYVAMCCHVLVVFSSFIANVSEFLYAFQHAKCTNKFLLFDLHSILSNPINCRYMLYSSITLFIFTFKLHVFIL